MFESIRELVMSVSQTEQPYILLVNVLVFIALFAFVFGLVTYLKDHNVFRNFVAKVLSDAREQERLREEEYQKRFEMEGRFESKDKMLGLNQKLIASGLKDKIPELQPGTFILFSVLAISTIAIIMSFMQLPAIGILITCGVFALCIVFLLESLVSINTARVEKETIKFINLLKNNSHMGGSVVEILGEAIPFLNGPLKSSVERCYYEIKSTGNVAGSLQKLSDRTNYKKLKEIFDSLRICSNHNEDYEGVIDEVNDSVEQYIEFRKETRQIKQNNLIEMIIMGGMGVFILYMIKDMLPDIDVMYYIFKTNIGMGIISIMCIILLFGIYKAVKNEE